QLARRLSDGVHASELAAALGITERTLRRRLLAEGTSLSAIADALRRERAMVLLRESDLSISAIAHQLGFADATAFSRAFRRYSGTSPERARRALERE